MVNSSLKSEKDLDLAVSDRVLNVATYVAVEAHPFAVTCILPCLCEATVGTVVSQDEVSQAYCKYCKKDTESTGQQGPE